MKHIFWCLAVIAIVGLALRIWLLVALDTNADECVTGLGAHRICQGGYFPLFFPQQRYMGASQMYLTAPLVWLLGAKLWVIRVVPFLFGLASWAWAVWLAWRWWDKWAGVMTAWIGALVVPLYLYWSVTAMANYPETLVLHLAVLSLLVVRHQRSPCLENLPEREDTSNSWRIYAAAFLTGMSIWVNPVLVPSLAVIWIWCGVHNFHRWKLRWMGRLLSPFLLGLFPFIAGQFLQTGIHSPPFHAEGYFPLSGLTALVSEGLPNMLTGAHHVVDDRTLLVLDFAQGSILAFLMCLGVWHGRKCANIWLLVTIAGTHLVTCGLALGKYAGTPRYLAPLFPLVLILAGGGLSYLTRLRWSVTLIVLAFLGFHGFSGIRLLNAVGFRLVQMDMFVSRIGVDQLIECLRATHTHAIAADYWTAYKCAFLSGDEIEAAPLIAPATLDRFPKMTARVSANPEAGYVIYIPEAMRLVKFLDDWLRAQGAQFQVQEVAYWYVFTNIRGAPPPRQVPWPKLAYNSTVASFR